ncbi:MAG TPA: methyltransferase [Gemmatimonadales bacterium]|jgi:23S rRNA (uracil1939-C5)-methyltransferase
MSDVVEVESLAAGGAGIAHLPDGMIVFVPRTAPGDRVTLGEVRRHKRHAEARAAEIVAPGPGRIAPRCPHFTADRCGGCQWQHIEYAEQLRAKAAIVGNALRRIGGLDVADPDVVPSPRPFGYRTTITLTVRRYGPRIIAGFHDAFDPNRVFMLGACPIARDEVNALWQETKPKLGALPQGDDVRLKLRVGRDGRRLVAASEGKEEWRGFGDDAPDESAWGFLQVNEEVAALLHAAVVESAGPGKRVLDLYAGAGDTALPLAAAGHEVVLVEMDSRAAKQAAVAAKAAGLKVKCIVGRVEDHLTHLLPADVVIVNPPRTGLSEEVTGRLRVCASARLVYVSCDPATLARDLKRLGVAADRIDLVRAYDMFPQTSHVETMIVIRP